MSFVSQTLLSGKRRKQFLQAGNNFDDYVVSPANKINSSGDVFATFNNTVGAARVYAWNGTSWIQRGSDITSSNSVCISIDSSGSIISLTGNTTSVYAWNGTSWIQRGTDIAVNGLVSALSSNGNFIIIGDQFSSANKGLARVYAWNGTSWVQRGQTFTSTLDAATLLGASVAINSNGDVIAIGEPFFGFYSGVVYVYTWNGTSWIEILQRTGIARNEASSPPFPGEQLGARGWISLDSSGTIISIGSPNWSLETGETYVGRVYNLKWNGSSWADFGQINNPFVSDQTKASNSYYGDIVSLNFNGDILAIKSSIPSGYKVDIFRKLLSTNWAKIGYITLPDNIRSLSINSSGNVLAVGTLDYSRIYRYT
jgi:hypothetical protein